MRLKERIAKLEEKIGMEDKGYFIAHLRLINQEGKKVFSVVNNNEEIGVFSTEEEAEKAVEGMAGGRQVILVKSVYANETFPELEGLIK